METEGSQKAAAISVLKTFNKSKVIPHGLPDLLEMVVREVLRSQPTNVIEFVANLLTNLVDLRNGKRDSSSDIEPMEIPVPSSLLPKSLGFTEKS